MDVTFRSGFIALIGRPNTGKSTLLNAILGQKVAIVTDRHQTTRNRIQGIKTLEDSQMIFVDTPGIHVPRHALGASMVRTTQEALRDIDVVAFVTDAGKGAEEDLAVISMLKDLKKPVVFVLNKADRRSPAAIARIMEEYSRLFPFAASVPVSALKEKGISLLLDTISDFLPAGPKYYEDDMVTDQYERFMASEIIREKIIKNTSEEVPHAAAVEILEWKEKKKGLISINAVIYIEREGQKGIIIGKKGEMLKTIGRQARKDIETLTGSRVYLELWVKVKKGWRDDKRILRELGY
jgi:GTP-binding protein Era